MALFYRTLAKVKELPPLHRDLVLAKSLRWRQSPAEWDAFLASLARHDEVTGGKQKYALDPAVHGVVVPLLRILCADAAPGSTVGMLYDGAGPNGRYGPEQPLPDQGIRRAVKQLWSVYPMLQATADLRDGSTVDVAVWVRWRLRKWRQSRGGKTKWKSKAKSALRYQVDLRLPKDTQPVRPASPTPPWFRTEVTQKKRFVIQTQLKSPGNLELNALLDTMTETFRWSPTASAGPSPGAPTPAGPPARGGPR